MRAGTIPRERLELAAVLAYEPAATALGKPAIRSHSLSRTFAALEPFGRAVVVRAGVVLAKRFQRSPAPDAWSAATIFALDRWCDCPCDEHEADVERIPDEEPSPDRRVLASRIVVRHVLDSFRGARASDKRWVRDYERDAVVVAAIRASLVPWALDPHPVSLSQGTRGELLDLRVGTESSPRTWRYLVAPRRFLIGSDDEADLNVEGLLGRHAEIVREGEVYLVRALDFGFDTHISERNILRAYLSSGDVISAGATWVEVRILAPPFDEEVVLARADAERFEKRGSADARARILAAAACGHLGASLAAGAHGIRLRPRFDVKAWTVTLRRLPPEPTVAGGLRVAREALPAWRKRYGEDASLEKALLAAETGSDAPRAERELGQLLRERNVEALARSKERGDESPRPLPDEEAAFAAGAVVFGCLSALKEGGEELTGIARNAIDAGIPEERVFDLLREEILRWALAT